MVSALLFDFDGVVVDTEVPTFQSWRDTYAEYGVDLALEDWLPAVGTGAPRQESSMRLRTWRG